MKKNINRRLLTATVHFFGFLTITIVARKFFTDRGVGPHSWEQIYHDLFFYIMISLFYAVVVFFGVSKGKKDTKNEKV